MYTSSKTTSDHAFNFLNKLYNCTCDLAINSDICNDLYSEFRGFKRCPSDIKLENDVMILSLIILSVIILIYMSIRGFLLYMKGYRKIDDVATFFCMFFLHCMVFTIVYIVILMILEICYYGIHE